MAISWSLSLPLSLSSSSLLPLAPLTLSHDLFLSVKVEPLILLLSSSDSSSDVSERRVALLPRELVSSSEEESSLTLCFLDDLVVVFRVRLGIVEFYKYPQPVKKD